MRVPAIGKSRTPRTRYVDCPHCKGQGTWYEDCPKCRGGKSGSQRRSRALHDCETCQGREKIYCRCDRCKGSGRVKRTRKRGRSHVSNSNWGW